MLESSGAAKKSHGSQHGLTVAVADHDNAIVNNSRSNYVGGPAATSLSLNSSTSSFFSLASSTGFRSPMTEGSGQRGFFNNNTSGTGQEAAAMRLFSQGFDGEGRDGGRPREVPIAHPKANRPPPSQIPPLASGPGFTTISTRGAPARRLALSDSPPPCEAAPRVAIAPSSSFNLQKPVARSTKSAFYVPSVLVDSVCPHEGLFTAPEQPSSQRVASSLTPTDASVQKRNNAGNSSSSNGDVKNINDSYASTAEGANEGSSLGPVLASTSPKPAPSSGSGDDGLTAKQKSTSVVANKGAALHAAPRGNLSSTDSFAQSIAEFAKASAERKDGASLTSAVESDWVRHSQSPPTLSAASQQKTAFPAHRYHEANEEAMAAVAATSQQQQQQHQERQSGTAATPPPPEALAAKKSSTVKPPSSSVAAHTVIDCTSRAERHRNPVRFALEQLSRLTNNPLLRRTSVSAAPVVPASWRPAARGQRSTAEPKAKASDAAASTGAAAKRLADGDARSSPQDPVRPTLSPSEDRSHDLVPHTGRAAGPQRPSVRFIYTRSCSTSKVASPDQSTLTHSGENEAQSAVSIAGTTPATASATAPPSYTREWQRKMEQQAKAAEGMASPGHALLPLRRNTVSSLVHDHVSRRSTVSVPFTRSATFAGVQERASREFSWSPSEGGSVPRRRSFASGEESQSNSGRGSRASVTRLDAPPQSYLMQWRQRQKERKAREEAQADMAEKAKTRKRMAPKSSASTTAAASSEAAVVDKTEKVDAAPDTAPPPASATVVNTPPPPLLDAAALTVPAVAAAAALKEDEVKPQPSAPAADALKKSTKEEPAATTNLVEEAPKRSSNTPASADVVSPASHSAYSLIEALRSNSLPEEAMTSNPATTAATTTTTPHAVVPPSASLPATLVPTLAPRKTPPPPPLEAATLTERPPSNTVHHSTATTPTTTTASAASPHHGIVSGSFVFTVQSTIGNGDDSGNSSPKRASKAAASAIVGGSTAAARLASLSVSGSYLTEDYVRREAVDEDIPEDQVVAAVSPTTEKANAQTRESEQDEASPCRSPTTVSAHTSVAPAVVEPSNESAAAPLQPPSTADSTQVSGATSARRSTLLPSPVPEKVEERDSAKKVASSTSDVRELCRSVLERREQRLQQQLKQEKSARRTTSERETQQHILTPPPLPSTSPLSQQQQLPHQRQQSELPNSSLASAVESEAVEVSRSTSKLGNASGRRTVASTPYTPSWKAGMVGNAPRGSRPPSTAAESAETATAAKSAEENASAACVSRMLTPTAERHHARLDSLLATTTTTALQKSARPSGSVTPSSVAGPTLTVRDGRSSVMAAAGPATDTEADDDDDDQRQQQQSSRTSQQQSSRISELLARRSSFASRLSHGGAAGSGGGGDGASTCVPNASFTRNSPSEARRGGEEEAGKSLATDHLSVPDDSVVHSTCNRGRNRSSAPLSAASEVAGAVAVAPLSTFDMAAVLESIPTAADIERDARLTEPQAIVSAAPDSSVGATALAPSHLTTAVPDSETVVAAAEKAREKPSATTAAPMVKKKTLAETTEEVSALTDMHASQQPVLAESQPQPVTAFAARPLVSPTETKTAVEAQRSPPTNATTADTPLHRRVAPAKGVSSATALGEIRTDELDKLEESVDALLRAYGKNNTTTPAAAAVATAEPHPTTKNGETGGKMTAADILLQQMPPHVQTTAEKKKAASAAAHLSHNAIAAKGASMEFSGSSFRRHATGSELDDEDSHWDASVLWCGEELDASPKTPPANVPPLDLSMLQLPTNEDEDLKPYRIPLPTAVPAPEENRRHIWKLAGILSASSASHENNNSGRSSSTMGGRNSGAFTGAGSLGSSHNKSSTSLADVSPFLGERIRRMKEQPPEPPAALAAARKLRVPRRAFLATAGTAAADSAGGGGSNDRHSNEDRSNVKAGRCGPPARPSEASEEEDEEDSIQEVVDEAPQRISRVVRFTDDSDALDGGRGAIRDMRVEQQKNRVRIVLLDCEEQRERKMLQAEEQNAFTVIGKSYRRSSLLTRND